MSGYLKFRYAYEFIEALENKDIHQIVINQDDGKKLIYDRREKTQWIPCSERLPEKGNVVLITNDKGNVRCGQYRGVWSFYERPTEWVWRGNTVETVIAWRYLPEAYEVEK